MIWLIFLVILEDKLYEKIVKIDICNSLWSIVDSVYYFVGVVWLYFLIGINCINEELEI